MVLQRQCGSLSNDSLTLTRQFNVAYGIISLKKMRVPFLSCPLLYKSESLPTPIRKAVDCSFRDQVRMSVKIDVVI